ncbi:MULTISPECIES: TrbC/VirB2 family protein [Bartonella]|uniref:Vbh2 n=2 Tax=Bartonella TaxID=773 RepID=A9IYD9_BART1|nr:MULTISPECIES: TrbC/VirB2 family protein [Bartonella]ADN97093.1 VblB2 protein [Bartonella sp. TT0105]CAK02344.1 Vbh2 precursor [Bartonella tribocorum CIP 105476]CDO49682.1 VblB2 protein [Bartonella tribocorum]
MKNMNNSFSCGHTLQKGILSNPQKKWLTTVLMLFVAFIALSEPAFADGGFGKIESALQKIISALTGPIAKSIATIAIAGIGIAWIAGYVEMRKAFFVCVGIGIIFGAPQIAAMFSS